jgi:P2 family phage contractile tail tube protein
MALPSKLKNLNVFNNGASYLGQVTSVTLPKLTRKMEDYRAGGMSAPVKIDHGLEPLEIEVKCGGLMRDAISQFGATQVDAVMLRFAGAYQRDDSGEVDAVEIIVRGRWSEIDMGEAKAGEDTEHTLKAALSYYQLTINGAEVALIDIINMIERYNGVDVAAGQRNALGGLSGEIGSLVPGAGALGA